MIDNWGRGGTGTQVWDCNALVVGTIPTRWNELLFINMSFIRLRSRETRGVGFYHSTRNADEAKWVAECLNDKRDTEWKKAKTRI